MEVEFNFKINGPQGAYVHVDIEINNTELGIFTAPRISFYLTKSNVDEPFMFKKYLYNGSDSEAHLYGFDFYISSDSNVTLKDRSVLIWQ
jgi:hypothetical protein